MDRGRSVGEIVQGLAVLVLWAFAGYVWKNYHASEWRKGLAALLAIGLPLAVVWLSARLLRHAATRHQRKTALAKGDRLSIYVARLGEDEISETARASVMDSIRTELGPERVEVLPAGTQLRLTEGVSLDEAALEATRKARKLLAKRQGDLLIWGRVHTIPQQRPAIELRFVSAAQPGNEGQRFGFTEKLMLEVGFGRELSAALAAVAAALSLTAVKDRGRYVAETLAPVAAKLVPLIRELPASMSSDDRGTLFFSYALAQYVIGEQRDDSAALEQAAAAFGEALKEFTRQRAPLNWAVTQNNLGNALASLGERESGTQRLEEAVAAYREALKERTRERVPLKWAGTHNNLGNALQTLGERQSGTEKLEQAVAAYREALKERTRERVPLDWAGTQNNLGNALQTLGERESGPEGLARLEEAVAAYQQALEVLTGGTAPRYQTSARQGLAKATKLLDARRSNGQ